MYIINKTEKKSYLKALVYIATADEKIEKEEIAYLRRLGELYEISNDELDIIIRSVINKEETLEEVLLDIKTRQNKLTLLFELIALCYADGNYSDSEKNGMRNICKILDIELGKLEEIEMVMIENFELQLKINSILER